MLEKAIQIAEQAHKEQKDKGGQPYIFHLFRVMQKGKTEIEQICGILHDLVEDTNWTFEDLKNEGFSEKIIDVLKCVTKKKGESYPLFVRRVAQNPIAIRVKMYDLEDNMDVTRLKEITDKDYVRIVEYHSAYNYLKSVL